MLTNLIQNSSVHTFSTDKSSNFDNLINLPELESTRIVTMDQVHGSDFKVVESLADSAISNTHIFGVDALITTIPNVTLTVKHADCLPILVYHPKGIIAAIHAGRRSTQQHILKKVLRHLKHHFGVTDSLELWFGPAICKDCHTTNTEKTEHFDLLAENKRQAEHIFSLEKITITYANRCTTHENEMFHSYRAEGPGVQMNWSAINLK